MVLKSKEYNVLDVEDVEKAVSKIVGRDVSIGELEVSVIDYIPLDDQDEGGDISQMCMDCEIYIDGEGIYVDEESYDSPISELISHDAYLSEEYIFNFSTDLFKSYTRYSDSSD